MTTRNGNKGFRSAILVIATMFVGANSAQATGSASEADCNLKCRASKTTARALVPECKEYDAEVAAHATCVEAAVAGVDCDDTAPVNATTNETCERKLEDIALAGGIKDAKRVADSRASKKSVTDAEARAKKHTTDAVAASESRMGKALDGEVLELKRDTRQQVAALEGRETEEHKKYLPIATYSETMKRQAAARKKELEAQAQADKVRDEAAQATRDEADETAKIVDSHVTHGHYLIGSLLLGVDGTFSDNDALESFSAFVLKARVQFRTTPTSTNYFVLEGGASMQTSSAELGLIVGVGAVRMLEIGVAVGGFVSYARLGFSPDLHRVAAGLDLQYYLGKSSFVLGAKLAPLAYTCVPSTPNGCVFSPSVEWTAGIYF